MSRELKIAVIFGRFGAGRPRNARILPILSHKLRTAAIFGNFGAGGQNVAPSGERQNSNWPRDHFEPSIWPKMSLQKAADGLGLGLGARAVGFRVSSSKV